MSETRVRLFGSFVIDVFLGRGEKIQMVLFAGGELVFGEVTFTDEPMAVENIFT